MHDQQQDAESQHCAIFKVLFQKHLLATLRKQNWDFRPTFALGMGYPLIFYKSMASEIKLSLHQYVENEDLTWILENISGKYDSDRI